MCLSELKIFLFLLGCVFCSKNNFLFIFFGISRLFFMFVSHTHYYAEYICIFDDLNINKTENDLLCFNLCVVRKFNMKTTNKFRIIRPFHILYRYRYHIVLCFIKCYHHHPTAQPKTTPTNHRTYSKFGLTLKKKTECNGTK